MAPSTPAPLARRSVLARRPFLAAAGASLFGAALRLAGALPSPALRLAISETVMGEVNLTDARVAMQFWLQKIGPGANLAIDPKIFMPTQEIVDRLRRGMLDAVAINVTDLRPMADLLDTSQVVNAAGAAGFEQYVLLAKHGGAVSQVGDLKGRRLTILKSPKMCAAQAWLTTVVDEIYRGPAEQFLSAQPPDAKPARVILPVFFGQADACLTTIRSYELMCELNPQVSRSLQQLASSPPLAVDFYAFRKHFPVEARERLTRTITDLCRSVEGRQVATLFQFDAVEVRDGKCLTSALNVLDRADKARARHAGAARRPTS